MHLQPPSIKNNVKQQLNQPSKKGTSYKEGRVISDIIADMGEQGDI
jgi:hypothetical protein